MIIIIITIIIIIIITTIGRPEEREEGGAIYEVLDDRGQPIAKGEEVTIFLFFFGFYSKKNIHCYMYKKQEYLSYTIIV
jgi:hypothetical protein